MWQDNIKAYLKAKNMTQDDLAFEVGVSQSAISGILTGKNKPKLDTLEAIAKVFKTSLSELFYEHRPTYTIENSITYIEQGPTEMSAICSLENYQDKIISLVKNTTKEDLNDLSLLLVLSQRILK